MADYESETTRFLRNLLDKHPEMEEQRHRNRATWWDKPLNPEEQAGFQAAEESKPAYAYFPTPKAPK